MSYIANNLRPEWLCENLNGLMVLTYLILFTLETGLCDHWTDQIVVRFSGGLYGSWWTWKNVENAGLVEKLEIRETADTCSWV